MSPASRAARSPSLRRRLGWLLVVAGLVLLAVLGGSAFALARVAQTQEDVTGPYFEAITRADLAYVGLLDAEVAVRSYVNSGNLVSLTAFEQSLGRDGRFGPENGIPPSLSTHHELVSSYARAEEAVRAWVDGYALQAVETTVEQGPRSVPAVLQAEGAVLFAEARAAMTDYRTALHQERSDRLEALERWTQVLFGSVLVLVGAALVVGVVLWIVLKRWITEPMSELAHHVRLVSSGHLEQAIVTTGPGEISGLADDIEHMRTELVSQVAEIKASHEEVEHSHDLLAEQARELERSNRDLEQFAYVASHDLQEPLRKVASFTQLLKKRYGGQLDERADQYIEFAVDGAKRMQRLIQDLLGFSRVGRTGTERVEVDLEEVLEEVLVDLADRVAEVGATVTHERLPVVLGERALLQQLLTNLLGNALKFRDVDRPLRVHLGVTSHETEWELSCTDNGIGIDPQYAERVFVIFQRLHAKDVYEGTGIGLALCKRIVEYHGGRIWIEPQPVGTRVRWTLAHARTPSGVGYAHEEPGRSPDDDGTTDGGTAR